MSFLLRTRERPHTSEVMVLVEDHPVVEARQGCAACHHTFQPQERIVMVVLGPGRDPEERQKAKGGGLYAAQCVLVHALCAGIPR